MTQRFTQSFLIMVMSLICLGATAQDIHYSQFYASPLTLNPALTGINDCSYRVNAMYRTQWSSIPAPYSTPSISFDINSLAPKVIKTGNLSAGLLIYNDRSGDGNLNNLTILGSGGYSIHPDLNKKHTVSIGLQLGYTQKRVDITKLIFEDQLQSGSGTSLESTAKQIGNKFGYLNIHSGLLWMFKPTEKAKVYLGAAAFNIISPKETFFNADTNKLNLRPVIHGGGSFDVNEKLGIHPSVLYMTQSGSQEITFGTALSVALKGNFNPKIYFGAYYRLKDAIIPVVTMDYRNFRVGLSYDVNTSSLNQATNYKGGFEISLSYTGCISSVVDVEPIQWCPRF